MGDRWQRWKDSQPVPEDWTVPGIAQREEEVVIDSGTSPRFVGMSDLEVSTLHVRERAWGRVPDDLPAATAFLWVEGYVNGFLQAREMTE